AARTGAAVLFAGVALDDTELLSRLVARALYREWPTLRESYSTIWSGEAWRNEATRKPLSSAVEAVMKKVGGRLHLFRAAPFQPLRAVEQAAAHLWSRHERVLLVVDGLDGFSAEEDAGARSTAVGPGGVLRAAYHLRQMSDKGCAVLVTVGAALHRWVTPAATLSAALRPGAGPAPAVSEAQALLGARAAELVVTKNQRGGTGTLPLLFIAGASVFENRDA
ncbi:MAG TPA: hypothetical protein VF989_19815, partial [Polyangiaceae bacterium]